MALLEKHLATLRGRIRRVETRINAEGKKVKIIKLSKGNRRNNKTAAGLTDADVGERE